LIDYHSYVGIYNRSVRIRLDNSCTFVMNITDNLKKKEKIKKYEIFPLSVKELKDTEMAIEA